METSLSKVDWIHRFGRKLMRLQPTMNAVTAAGAAVDAYPDTQDVEPEEAAKIWVDDAGLTTASRSDCGGNVDPSPPVARKLVLIVDDFDDSAEMLAEQVELECGHEAVFAKDGIEALEVAAARRARDPLSRLSTGFERCRI